MRSLSLPSLIFLAFASLQGLACDDDSSPGRPLEPGGSGGAGGGGPAGSSGKGGAGGGASGQAGQGGAPSAKASALVSGSRHVCAIVEGGGVRCWGGHESGQLGDGSSRSELRPTPVTRVSGDRFAGAKGVQVAEFHGCAMADGGQIWCWGGAEGASPSSPELLSARPVEGSPGVSFGGAIDFDLGPRHACALMPGGEVRCWGDNTWGQLGDDTLSSSDYPVRVDEQPGKPLRSALAVGVGFDSSCALMPEGEVHCWGSNLYGQLGDGTESPRERPAPVELEPGVPLKGALAIGVGAYHACALMPEGKVLCWGSNYQGQIGNGAADGNAQVRPAQVELAPGEPLSGVTGLATFASHTCALMPQGQVRCWGYNGSGQLGDGTTIDHSRPVLVELEPGAPLEGVLSLGLGVEHSCAVVEGGALRCWGANGLGQLGDGQFVDRVRPVAVEISAGTPLVGASVVAPGSQHTCALMPGGEVHCWGDNYYGQLGNGHTTNEAPSGPVVAELSPGVPLAGVEGLALGLGHTCALAPGGEVKCWGSNLYGQLGNGNEAASLWPVTVELEPGVPLAGVVSLAAGGWHDCALTAGGEAYCWGSNSYGQLGDGSIFDQSRPVRVGLDDVTPLGGVAALALGDQHSCALTTGGEVYCWGRNVFGQLGDGTIEDRRRPVRIDYAPGVPLQGLSAVAAGPRHTCAVRSEGGAYCWGHNDFGQLGSNEEAEKMLVPALVESSPGVPLAGITGLDVGTDHSCALVASGEMQCWGSNVFGMLGNGRTGFRTRPGPVLLEEGGTHLTGVRTTVLGEAHSCALTVEGHVYCWGGGLSGETGIGGPYNHLYPEPVIL